MNETNIASADLNLLVTLDALLRHQSVSKTAAVLGLSQSAVSHQLRKLRSAFDDALLVPGAGGMVPTPLAEQLELPLRASLADLWQVVRRNAGFDPATSRRTFHIATEDLVEVLGVLPLLDFLEQTAPGVAIESHRLGTASIDALEAGEIDLAIGPDFATMYRAAARGLKCKTLSVSPFECIVRAGHPVTREPLTVDSYTALSHISAQPDEARWHLDDALAERGITRNVICRSPSTLSTLMLVAGSDYSCTVPFGAVDRLLARLHLATTSLPFDAPESTIVLTWHERFETEPGNVWLRNLVMRVNDVIPCIPTVVSHGWTTALAT